MDLSSLIPDFGSLGEPIAYLTLFVLTLGLSALLFLPVPVVSIVIAAATVLDPFWVGVTAGVASAIGELSGYFVGVASEKALNKKKKEGAVYNRAKGIFQKYGFWGIVAMTLSPITLIDVMGIIAGALRYSWKKFFLATLIGKIPRYLLVAYAGKATIEKSVDIFSENPVWGIIAVLAVIAIIDFYYFWSGRKSKKKNARTSIRRK